MNEWRNKQTMLLTYTVTKNKENHNANVLSDNTNTTSFISTTTYSFFLPGVLLNGRHVSQLMIPATSITVVRKQLVTLKFYHFSSVLQGRFLNWFVCVFTVSEGKYCSDLQLDPVCDSDNNQHPNLCSLQFNRKSLAYRGFCKVSYVM